MAIRNQSRWRDVDHSTEPLLQHIVLRASTRTTGPIPEFLAKETAEREPRTLEWYRGSLMQLWEFLEAHDLTLVQDFNEGHESSALLPWRHVERHVWPAAQPSCRIQRVRRPRVRAR